MNNPFHNYGKLPISSLVSAALRQNNTRALLEFLKSEAGQKLDPGELNAINRVFDIYLEYLARENPNLLTHEEAILKEIKAKLLLFEANKE